MKVATVQHVNGELALLLCPLSFVEMSLFIDQDPRGDKAVMVRPSVVKAGRRGRATLQSKSSFTAEKSKRRKHENVFQTR